LKEDEIRSLMMSLEKVVAKNQSQGRHLAANDEVEDSRRYTLCK
jgi:hypothetical protein